MARSDMPDLILHIRRRLDALQKDMGEGVHLRFPMGGTGELSFVPHDGPVQYVDTSGGPEDPYANFFKHAPEDIEHLLSEVEKWKARAAKHGCDTERGDPDCG